MMNTGLGTSDASVPAASEEFDETPGSELVDHYRSLETRWTIRDNADYEALVTPNGNSTTPIHRWFHFKEGYSHRLLGRVLKDTQADLSRPLTVLDPYAGSGTTLISALNLLNDGELTSVKAFGVEINPFLHIVATAKVAGATNVDDRFLEHYLDAIATFAMDRRRRGAPTPTLSTFGHETYWPEVHLNELGRLRSALDSIECDDDGARAIAGMIVGATVEPASYLRRDGRALRHAPLKQPVSPIAEFCRRAELAVTDVTGRGDGAVAAQATVGRGDARALDVLDQDVVADLVLFSPPYPNNIDYTEVYKLEAWALGLIRNQAEFRAQRARTVRSHPSLKWEERYAFSDTSEATAVESLLAPLVRAIPDSRDKEARKRLVYGYADDMLATLRSCKSRMRKQGSLVFVVGNSLHGHAPGSWLFAADLIISRLGEIAGFEVDSIEVARRPARRRGGGDLLRESVVFLHTT